MAVGSDPMSQRLLTFMEAEKLDADLVQRSGQAGIGLCAVTTDNKDKPWDRFYTAAPRRRTRVRANTGLR